MKKEELTRIEKVIGESFVTNELFHNWGTIEERRSAVLAYMKIYVDCVYRAGELYGNICERTSFRYIASLRG